jgi:hypothetical protein
VIGPTLTIGLPSTLLEALVLETGFHEQINNVANESRQIRNALKLFELHLTVTRAIISPHFD